MRSTRELLDEVPQTGRLEWIGVRTARRGPVEAVETAQLVAGLGIAGDHRTREREPDPSSRRQLTLVQAEHLPAVAAIVGRDVTPDMLRRNLVVSGLNLASLRGRRFRIGDAVCETSGPCHPCSRMEENLGVGGFQAMRGHGGLTARIIEGGTIRVGDPVTVLPADDGAVLADADEIDEEPTR